MAEPDAPFVMETICIGGHGIASGYRACAGGAGRSSPCSSGRDDAARAWGFGYTDRRCRSPAQRSILTAALHLLTKYVRWCIR